jgi:uncharacterized protein (TIGR00661 family)
MRILYGIQATGNGHINRSREVVKELKKRGHEVSVIFSGREEDKFWGIESFSPYKILRGLTFQTKNGELKLFKTASNLNFFQFYKDIYDLSNQNENYDLVISDFEPITSRFAKNKKIPSINLSHQACFYYKNIPYKLVDTPAVIITKNFSRCDINIGIHWDNFNNKEIIPPIIPMNLKSRTIPNKYLIYLPFEDIDTLKDVFNEFENSNFFIYTNNKLPDTKNIYFRNFSREGFLNDLEECEGVICNAGFELISESLYLGKKLLVKPVKGQMEQTSNGECIRRLNLGFVSKSINETVLYVFIKTNRTKKIEFCHTSKLFVDWLEEEDWYNIKKLSKICWEGGRDERMAII